MRTEERFLQSHNNCEAIKISKVIFFPTGYGWKMVYVWFRNDRKKGEKKIYKDISTGASVQYVRHSYSARGRKLQVYGIQYIMLHTEQRARYKTKYGDG